MRHVWLVLVVGLISIMQNTLAASESSFSVDQAKNLYHQGLAENGTINKALDYSLPYAQAGNIEAMFIVGVLFDEVGSGITPESFSIRQQRTFWLTEAAEKGHSRAQFLLGHRFVFCPDNEEDYNKALYYLSLASESGIAEAFSDLGAMHLMGKGVPKDYEIADEYFSKSVDLGGGKYAFSAGFSYDLYAQGSTVYKSRAAYWYKVSADMGYGNAQSVIADRYIRGEGVAKDETLAYMWLNLCACNDWTEVFSRDIRERCSKDRDELSENMSRGEIAEAQKLTREWLKNHAAIISANE